VSNERPHIRLDQLLKREGLAGTGGQAKFIIQDGLVKVDGQVETRRGRKLFGGERVEVGGHSLEVEALELP
jgi:ribosome-associated protein